MYTIGHLFNEELEGAYEWWAQHQDECEWASGKKYAGAIGGIMSWIITPTSIGDLISMRCACGAEKLVNGKML